MKTPTIEELSNPKIKSCIKSYIKREYPELFDKVNNEYIEDISFVEKLYWWMNGLKTKPKCVVCGGDVRFRSFFGGYPRTCGGSCTAKDINSKQKSKLTKTIKYGDPNYNNRDQSKCTCKEKYGVEFVTQTDNQKSKSKQTKLERYGDENYVNLDKIKQTKLERYGDENYNNATQIKNTCRERYGVDFVTQTEEFKADSRNSKLKLYDDEYYTNREKCKATMMQRYGVEYGVYLESAKRNITNNSKPNREFQALLEARNIQYEREYRIQNYIYDFKVGDILIEINPTATHNSTWGVFGAPKDKQYHINKSQIAQINGYKCIHIWDWDDVDKILNQLQSRTSVGARKCVIKDVSKIKCDEFLDKYHLQNSCNGQTIRLGLYYNDELVEIMTFGKPRYNKKYEWELLRLCYAPSYNIIGGANKLLKYFIDNYNPTNIISYCDNSKFDGGVYEQLGFELMRQPTPSKHWWNGKTHITDNLLRQRGFDQLFNTKYGKGTSNEQLMIDSGFVEIYDCGQSTYVTNIR